MMYDFRPWFCRKDLDAFIHTSISYIFPTKNTGNKHVINKNKFYYYKKWWRKLSCLLCFLCQPPPKPSPTNSHLNKIKQ